MSTDNAAIANSIAEADKRLETLLVLCGILTGRIEASRRDLRIIKSAVASAQKCQGVTHAAEISADLLVG
jgi:hypothetical protein